MTLNNKTLRAAVVATVALVCVTGFAPAAITPALADTGVAVVVNKTAITNTDLARRIAFLKLRHETGDVAKKARQELIDEQLKRQEIARVGMSVSTTDVDQAFGRFAASNKLSTQQMGQILDKACCRRRALQSLYCGADELATTGECPLCVALEDEYPRHGHPPA